jgi:hypothetical protein
MTIFTYTSGVPMNQGGRNRKDSPVSAPTGQVSPRSLPHYVVTSLLCISIVREQPRESRRPSDSVSCFHKLTNCPSPNSHPSILLQMPRGGMRPPIPNIPTFKPDNVLNPVESALPQNGRVTPLESALAKKGGGGSELSTRYPLNIAPFQCRGALQRVPASKRKRRGLSPSFPSPSETA